MLIVAWCFSSPDDARVTARTGTTWVVAAMRDLAVALAAPRPRCALQSTTFSQGICGKACKSLRRRRSRRLRVDRARTCSNTAPFVGYACRPPLADNHRCPPPAVVTDRGAKREYCLTQAGDDSGRLHNRGFDRAAARARIPGWTSIGAARRRVSASYRRVTARGVGQPNTTVRKRSIHEIHQ